MASSITAVRGTANQKQKLYWHDPADATVATKIAWLPIKGMKSLMAAVLVASAHAVVTFKVFAATDSSGTGATEVVAHATPTVADAAGDALYLDCTVDQVKDVLPAATHVSVELDMSSAAALAAVSYVFDMDRAYAGQTSDQIA